MTGLRPGPSAVRQQQCSNWIEILAKGSLGLAHPRVLLLTVRLLDQFCEVRPGVPRHDHAARQRSDRATDYGSADKKG